MSGVPIGVTVRVKVSLISVVTPVGATPLLVDLTSVALFISVSESPRVTMAAGPISDDARPPQKYDAAGG